MPLPVLIPTRLCAFPRQNPLPFFAFAYAFISSAFHPFFSYRTCFLLARVGSGWPTISTGRNSKRTKQLTKKEQQQTKNQSGLKGPACGCQQAMAKQKSQPPRFFSGSRCKKKKKKKPPSNTSSTPGGFGVLNTRHLYIHTDHTHLKIPVNSQLKCAKSTKKIKRWNRKPH